MKIESPNINKIIVELSNEDMENFDITYEEFDYSNIETRRVIWTILDSARKHLNRDIDPSQEMTIETLPSKNGGCMIFFTVEESKLQKIKTLPMRIFNRSVVCEFKSIDDIIDLYQKLKMQNDLKLFDAELFEKSEKYRLIIDRMPDTDEIKNILNEYAMTFDESEILVSHTREFWQKINSNIFC